VGSILSAGSVGGVRAAGHGRRRPRPPAPGVAAAGVAAALVAALLLAR
jgi:hypothetical protein